MKKIVKDLQVMAKELQAYSRDKLLIDFTRYKLNNDLFWLKTALKLIYGNQTNDEQLLEKTIHKNLKGFNKPDADIITDIIREYLLTSGRLTSKTTNILFRILPKYSRQLYKKFAEIRDRAEEEIADPILRDKYIIPEHFKNEFFDTKKTNRNYNFGDDIVIPKKEQLIYTGSIQEDLQLNDNTVKEINNSFGKTAIAISDLHDVLFKLRQNNNTKEIKLILDNVQDALEKIDEAMDLWQD